MRFQKMWAVLLAGSMLLTVGCGAKETASTESPADLEQESIFVGEPAAEANMTAVSETKGAPQVHLTPGLTRDWYSADGSHWILHAEYADVSVSGEGYEKLAESVHTWSESNLAAIVERGDEAASWEETDSILFDEDMDYYAYSISQEIEAARTDDRVVSLVVFDYEYMGGAHGNYSYTGTTFDSQTGAVLTLSDILKDAGGFRAAATPAITKKLEAEYAEGLYPDYGQTVDDMWGREGGPNWYLDASGITFVFQPYEVGPYAMGDARVTLPYEDFSEYLKEEYMLGQTGVVKLYLDEQVGLYLSALDSQPEQVRVYMDEDEYGSGPIYVELNGSKAQVGEYFARIGDIYLLKKENGKTFLILDADYASDDYVTLVYDLTGGTYELPDGIPQKCEELNGVSLGRGSVNTEELTLNMHLDVLGTYGGWMDYTLDESGKLQQERDFFLIASEDSPWGILTTVRELPVTIDGQAAVLPAGSRIQIKETDNQGIARFRNADTGEIGEIHYTRGDGVEDTWTIYIDGVEEWEYFETLPYAG